MSTNEQKQTIVVVDDDREVRDLIEAFFKPKGFHVLSFDNADSAVAQCRVAGQSWDVILTDYHFENMTGVDFTRKIHQVLPTLPIILITPPEGTGTAFDALKQGAYDFIVTPIHFSQLQGAVERALHLKEIKEEMSELRENVRSAKSKNSRIIGRSPQFLAALDLAKRVADSSTHIFITGESGTGKEVFAKFIHDESHLKTGAFVAINCSAIPENLLESELFGHAKGSFTGALNSKKGLFEEAENGTLFLDEIGDLSLPLQAKLLRVLQDKQIRRVGENQYRPINCRIISATHKNLEQEVDEHRFREDLYFRLNVIPIAIPPLRDRPEDVLLLAESFLRRFALENSAPSRTFSKEAVQYILDNQWRGNVRELENAVERAVVLNEGSVITLEVLKPLGGSLKFVSENTPAEPVQNSFVVPYTTKLPILDDVLHQYIEYAVKRNGGARDKTAKALGIDRKTLYKRMRVDSETESLSS